MPSSSTPTHARTSKRKELRQDRFITFYARAWEFADNNRGLLYAALAALVVLVLAIGGYIYYQSQQQEEAQRLLGQIVSVYGMGDYRAALDGTGDRPGLLQIADAYGGTAAGNMATFYAADALYELDEYERALEYYEAYDAGADLLGASAIAAQAAVYENMEQFEEAAAHYLEAAEQFESLATTPQYLLSAGRAYEQAGRYEAAIETYERLGEDYPEAVEAEAAQRLIARARARQGR